VKETLPLASVYSGPGNDHVNTAGDQANDTVYCGTGYDTLVANPHDRVGDTPASEVVQQALTTACEKVTLHP
jgi:hypothetical protein